MEEPVERKDFKRRPWAVWLLLTLAVAVGLKIFVARQAGDGGVATASTEPAASAVAASAPEPQWGEAAVAAARVARAASAALATARSAAGLAPKPPAELVIDLCGVGRMTMPEPAIMASSPQPPSTWELLPQPLGLWARNEAWPRVLAAMDDAAQPERVRAAAQALRASGLLTAEAKPAPQPAPVQTELAAATQALARLARRSKDAAVMAWALAVCDRQGSALADCRRITVRDLARLAPDDAQVWWAIAALPNIKAAERDAAMDRAGAAPRFGGAYYQLPRALDSAWPADLPDYLRLELLVRAIGIEAALQPQDWLGVLKLCSVEALAEPGRRARCEAMARQAQTHAQTLLAQQVAQSLGGRLGWSTAELEAQKSENAALVESAASIVPTDQPYACKAVEDTRQYIGSVADEGELQALRRRLAMKPITPRPAASRP